MSVTKNSHARHPSYLEVGSCKFQVVHSLSLLTVRCLEIQKRILAANGCFLRTEKVFEIPF